MNNKGETFVETLAALLIITLVITGFTGVIANLSKMNKEIKDSRLAFDKNSLDKGDPLTGWTYTISPMMKEGSSLAEGAPLQYSAKNGNINMYKDKNEIYYYEYE